MDPLRLTIVQTPRTKKTHNRTVDLGKRCPRCRRGVRTIVLPSESFEAFEAAVAPPLRHWMAERGLAPIAHPVNVAAIFYREALRGDAVGFYQALADVLQAAGVVVDDKWIVSWDGSRLDTDSARPRIELVITSAGPVPPEQGALAL